MKPSSFPIKSCLVFCTLLAGLLQSAQAVPPEKNRVIATTDGEVDDRCSMLRFLLYANEWDIQGLVHSSSKYHWKGDESTPGKNWNPVQWLDGQIDAYAAVYPRLIQHDPGYPSPEYLRSRAYVGNIASVGDMRAPTPGSDRIVEVLLQPDESPVWLQAWGGSNTIARALKTIREQYPDRIAEVTKKARIYLITEQDDTFRTYIHPEWPGITVLRSGGPAFGAIAYHWRKIQPAGLHPYFDATWMTRNILQGHGPLCGMYEANKDGSFRSEGDSPAFLHLIPTGLRSEENPGYGGWGGRFALDGGYWRSTDTDGCNPHSILRWATDFQNDWAARADWCVKDFGEANHAPVLSLEGPLDRRLRPGEKGSVAVRRLDDPDGDLVSLRWWQFIEAGTASEVRIEILPDGKQATFQAPEEPGKTIHLIAEAADNGTPPLKHWQRVVFTIAE